MTDHKTTREFLEALAKISESCDAVIQANKNMADATSKMAETMREIRKNLEREG